MISYTSGIVYSAKLAAANEINGQKANRQLTMTAELIVLNNK